MPSIHNRRRHASRVIALGAAASTAALLLPSPRAAAVNIVLSYNSGSSIEPAADPTGSRLQAIMAYVETYYQDIFEDAHTLTLTYWWDNNSAFSQPGTLAAHTLSTEGGSPWREISGTIQFNNSFSWFFDSTPADDSEFTMSQTLWRDLSASQQSNFFNGTAPATFEVGYTGTATVGGGAAGVTDLLSVALHETGHALGMSSNNNATVSQTNDSDYDFNPNFVNGNSLAAVVASGGNIAHLAGSQTLMQPSIGTGIRRRPSHTDLFSMASGDSFSNLDVPRREFYGGSNWNTAADWSGNTVPGSADESHVRNPGSLVTMGLSANGVAGSLIVEEGAWVSTNAFKLDVTNATTINGAGTAASTRIRVQASGELETADLNVLGTGHLTLIGGLADILDDATVDTDSFVEGYGTLQVASKFNNDGTLRANDSNGNLTLTTAGSGVWDLDGTSGNGIVEATSGNIIVTGTLSDAFDGTMNVSSSRTITFNSGWSLGPGGDLNLNGSSAIATIAGTSTISGHIDVTGDGRFTGAVAFNSGASVSIPSGANLTLSGATTYNGGSYTGAGTLTQNGNATVAANTTIAVDTLDWDGTGGTTVTTINNGVTLTIDSHVIDLGGATYNGTVNVNGGTLAVNTTNPWSMGGTLNLATATGSATLNGSPVVVSASLNATGGNNAVVNAAATFTSAAAVSVSSGTDLILHDATFNGGSYTGLGELTQSGDFVIGAHTTIATSTFDWGNSSLLNSNSLTINSGITFTVNSSSTGTASNDFRGTLQLNSGNLVVNTSAPWTLPASSGSPFFTPGGTLNLVNAGLQPTVSGQSLTVGGSINVTGVALISAGVTFNSTAHVSAPLASDALSLTGPTTYGGGSYTGLGAIRQTGAATVTANTTVDVGTFDLDGTSENLASLTVNSGVSLTVNSSKIDGGSDGYDGTITLNSATLAVNTAAAWGLEGTLNMNKPGSATPTLSGAAEVLQTGTLNAASGGLVSAPYRFGVTPTVNVPASTLLLSNSFSSNAGATMTKTGAGTLRVSGPQTHAAGATIIVNAGTLLMDTNADSGAGPNLRVTLNSTGHAVFNATQRLDSLIINNNSDALLAAGGSRVLYTHTISITGTGFLELNDNDAVIDYAGATPFNIIRGYLSSGYNAGNWNGVGIRSNSASVIPNHLTALALAEAATIFGLTGPATAIFDGQTVDATSLLIKYTWYGDANFNGKIDADDFALLDHGRALGLAGWTNGDFNYDNAINVADYLLIDKSYLLQSGTLAPDFLAMREAEFGADYVQSLLISIPEPTALAACGLTLLPLARRRRQPTPNA